MRCWTCHKVIGRYEALIERRLKAGVDLITLIEDLRLRRWCCKAAIRGHYE